MDSRIEGILSEFNFEGNIINCKQFGEGHINRTYLIETDTNKKYILQKINEKTFANIDNLMSNMSAVCEFLEKKSSDPRTYMHIVKTKDGKTYIKNEEGAWRITDYIENTVCLQSVENTDEFLESAIGFGKFQNMLSDFPVEKLHETIVNFHNTPNRYAQLEESIKKDVVGRVKEVQKEIDYILSKKEEASILQRMRDSGELPSRVTHNDTKLNNVLLDEKTHKAICVIDLDTVMPGLAAYDFGDSIRFGAATAAEDEKDLNELVKRYLEKEGYEADDILGTIAKKSEKPIVISTILGTENINDKFDVIISNPPYIGYDEEIMDLVKNNEPHLALYADNDGLYFYEEIIKNANNNIIKIWQTITHKYWVRLI